jgi:hypothetical protein
MKRERKIQGVGADLFGIAPSREEQAFALVTLLALGSAIIFVVLGVYFLIKTPVPRALDDASVARPAYALMTTSAPLG